MSGTDVLAGARPLSSISCTKMSMLVLVAASDFATDSVEGQRGRPSGLYASGLAKKAGLDPTTFNKSKRITPEGRDRLRASGFAPPAPVQPELPLLLQLALPVRCPNCGSFRTVLENAFGPTQCRAIHHCTACRQPFEGFKAV